MVWLRAAEVREALRAGAMPLPERRSYARLHAAHVLAPTPVAQRRGATTREEALGMDASPLVVDLTAASDVNAGDVLIANTLVGPRACLVVRTEPAGTKVSLHVLDTRTWQWADGLCHDRTLVCAAGAKLGRQRRDTQ